MNFQQEHTEKEMAL